MNRLHLGMVLTLALSTLAASAVAQDRETKVRGDRKTVEDAGYWLYNELPQGFAEANRLNKPLLVTIRCIPCEACAQLDAQIVSRDPVVQKLLDEFVCVRIVHANGLNLSLFQYDYDQSFAAFFLNADQTIYGRYGTRSHQTESDQDVSVEGFARALEGALALHKQYPANKESLKAKRGADAAIAVPEQFPSLKEKYGPRLDYTGNVVKSCIHCHQVGEALRLVSRDKQGLERARIIYPYPNPRVLGLSMDPKERAKVLAVAEGSSAAKDGFRAGDELLTLAGQPILSTADIQWVLHNAGESGKLTAEVSRQGAKITLPVTLESGWRSHDDISWRATSWDLRRMTTGGMKLDTPTADERRAAGLAEGTLALIARHVGQYGDHAAAKKAGFLQGDILVEIDGKSSPLTESQLMVAFYSTKKPGETVPVVVLRDGQRVRLTLPIQ